MGKYGRPKADPSKRRDAGSINIKLNLEEKIIVKEKARDAGLTPHEWARLAALERNPPPRQIIPELNKSAWRETARTLATLKGTIYRCLPGRDDSLKAVLEGVRDELVAVRKSLVGGDKS